MNKQVKTSELTGAALDWAVAKCEGVYSVSIDVDLDGTKRINYGGMYPEWSTDWAQGGPIIERAMSQGMNMWFYPDDRKFQAVKRPVGRHDRVTCGAYGPTPLIAAMRCYVASKLGDIVEIPEELLK